MLRVTPRNDIAGIQSNTNYEVDWKGSIRGRLGYAFDNRWMVYGTAGVAFAHQKMSRDQYRFDEVSYSQNTLFFIEKDSGVRTGLTVGGGAEYAINDRWSISADYTYSRFGNKSFSFDSARSGTGLDYYQPVQVGTEIIPVDPWNCEVLGGVFCEPMEQPIMEYVPQTGSSNVVNGRKSSNSLDTHTVKLGLNFHF